ncbi:MAG: SEL1-like repeat protein [Gammaproteobacteria bacterium]|nr:SEL1-like repeat protein [Gammaproteobacteria bacterium]
MKNLGRLLAAAMALTGLGAAAAAVERANPDDLEELTVSAERLPVPSRIEIMDTYQAQGQGTKHFRSRDYARAYPHLLTAAKRGFKTAQARLAYIYLHGLGGIPYDPVRGVGWLSAAASPETLPWIRRYSKRIWDIVPARYVADLETVADRYRAKYGRGASGVSCNRNRAAGTHRTSLTCLFDAEPMHETSMDREALRGLWCSRASEEPGTCMGSLQ